VVGLLETAAGRIRAVGEDRYNAMMLAGRVPRVPNWGSATRTHRAPRAFHPILHAGYVKRTHRAVRPA
jgi:hypothetical protein